MASTPSASSRNARGPGVRTDLGLPADAKILLMVARISAEKRPEVLPAAIAELAPEWVGVHVGPDSGYGPVAWRVHDAHCPGRCYYLGSREDVGDWYAAADAFLQPSESEGHSLALVEAMLAGCPVLSTPVGTVPEHPDLVRLLPPLADGAAVATAVRADESDPAGTRARVERARAHALTHWTTATFARVWTDYLCARPCREARIGSACCPRSVADSGLTTSRLPAPRPEGRLLRLPLALLRKAVRRPTRDV